MSDKRGWRVYTDGERFGSAVVSELHQRIGLCGCHLRRCCEGQDEHSVLPDTMERADVIAAIRAAEKWDWMKIEEEQARVLAKLTTATPAAPPPSEPSR